MSQGLLLGGSGRRVATRRLFAPEQRRNWPLVHSGDFANAHLEKHIDMRVEHV